MKTRQGTILIIVAGLSALLASMALVFLARQRSSQQETIWFEQDVQSRIMLVAACSYIAEAARIGYDTAIGAEHIEAYGWVDVRDGSVGPNTRGSRGSQVIPLHDARLVESWGRGTADRPGWPALKSVARCPMHVLERPPFAISLNATPNAMATDDSDDATYGRPYLKNPDPSPQADTLTGFMTANRDIRQSSASRSWFRVYREGPATFIVTCGAGGTLGYRDWDEVQGAGANAMAEFGEQAYFNSLRNQEIRLWYRVEWDPGIATAEVHNIKNAWNSGNEDHYVSYSMNTSNSSINPRSQAQCRNLGGTFRYIQRLRVPPTWW